MSTGASNHEKIQTVVFVRHGVARHNLYVDGKPPNLEDPMLFDPPLVFEGKKQALDVGERLRNWWHTTQHGKQIELVVTSPLTRCIQTASLAFLRGDCYTDGRQEPAFFCSELIREAYGMHYPDRRRNKHFLEVSIVASSGRLPFSSSSCII
jgi:bisphosphoglycerate-dependent phosphoglycerate mutase